MDDAGRRALQRELEAQRAVLAAEKRALHRVRRLQRLWWPALLALGFALGYAAAEWIIDPVTIIVPRDSGIAV